MLHSGDTSTSLTRQWIRLSASLPCAKLCITSLDLLPIVLSLQGDRDMDWNEFNRELQNRVSDPGVRYCLGIVYERLLDVAKGQDMTGQAMLAMAETMSNLVKLNDVQEGRLQDLKKYVTGEHAGVELSSVPITNED